MVVLIVLYKICDKSRRNSYCSFLRVQLVYDLVHEMTDALQLFRDPSSAATAHPEMPEEHCHVYRLENPKSPSDRDRRLAASVHRPHGHKFGLSCINRKSVWPRTFPLSLRSTHSGHTQEHLAKTRCLPIQSRHVGALPHQFARPCNTLSLTSN